jgi:hypothetical protein
MPRRRAAANIPNDPKVIRKTFGRMLAEVHELRCCYEAGPCGYEVMRLLEQMGIECVVVDPRSRPDSTEPDQLHIGGFIGESFCSASRRRRYEAGRCPRPAI